MVPSAGSSHSFYTRLMKLRKEKFTVRPVSNYMTSEVRTNQTSVSVSVSVCLSVCLSPCLSVCLPVCLPVSLMERKRKKKWTPHASVCLSVCLSLSVSLFVCIDCGRLTTTTAGTGQSQSGTSCG